MSDEHYYVYFYYQNDEIIYIGKTINIKKRHQQHMLEQDFIDNPYTHISILQCNTAIDMDILEKYFIATYQPKMNTIDINKGLPSLNLNISIPDKITKEEFESNINTYNTNNIYNNNYHPISAYNFILNDIKQPSKILLDDKIIKKQCFFTINPDYWLNYDFIYSQYRLLFWLLFIYQESGKNNNFYPYFMYFDKASDVKGHGGHTAYNINKKILQDFINLNLITEDSTSSQIIFTQKMIDACKNSEYNIQLEFCSFFQQRDVIKTKYSTKLLLFLAKNNFNDGFYSVEDLRKIFNSLTDRAIDFQRNKLFPAIKELNEKMPFSIQIEKVKQSRNLIGFNFLFSKILENN